MVHPIVYAESQTVSFWRWTRFPDYAEALQKEGWEVLGYSEYAGDFPRYVELRRNPLSIVALPH